jgi:hypothetical protein
MSLLHEMTTAEFLAAAQSVAGQFPDAVLVKNPVGNLTVLVNDEYVAWVDLRWGELHLVSSQHTDGWVDESGD